VANAVEDQGEGEQGDEKGNPQDRIQDHKRGEDEIQDSEPDSYTTNPAGGVSRCARGDAEQSEPHEANRKQHDQGGDGDAREHPNEDRGREGRHPEEDLENPVGSRYKLLGDCSTDTDALSPGLREAWARP
jgi:hypothetical protein